jgi:hypothetical protein
LSDDRARDRDRLLGEGFDPDAAGDLADAMTVLIGINLGRPDLKLLRHALDAIVDDAAGNQERLVRALNLERLLAWVVSPLQGEAFLPRFSAV